MRVITYHHAQGEGMSTLCRRHVAKPPKEIPALGHISHGEHEGSCDACWRESVLLDNKWEPYTFIAYYKEMLTTLRTRRQDVIAMLDKEIARVEAEIERAERFLSETR